MITKRDAERRSGTWLTCWECGDWYGPAAEAAQRPRAQVVDNLPPRVVAPLTAPACPKCGGFL